MPVVPEAERIATLRRWGISEPVIRLSCGERLHDLFRISCHGPPYYVYHEAEVPDGPPFAPFWEFAEGVTGVWRQGGGLEFIAFDVEGPEEYWVLAHTEQGFLAGLFFVFHQNRDDLQWADFEEPARVVGFRYLSELVAAYEQAEIAYIDAFQRHFVAGVDAWEGGGAEAGASSDRPRD